MSLQSIRLSNFKCFKELRLPLRPLTVLAGYNAAGKSTALQGLLLLAQKHQISPAGPIVPLSGPLVRLGDAGEIFSESSDRQGIILEFDNQQEHMSWCLQHLSGRAVTVTRKFLESGEDIQAEWKHGESEERWFESAFKSNLVQTIVNTTLISAVRQGAAEVFPVPDVPPSTAGVGVEGQYAPWCYTQMADSEVDPARMHPSEPATSFRRQLDAYLGSLFPGAQANAADIPKTSLVRLEFKTSVTSGWHRPANVGYGLTYAFPVLTALLAAEPGQVIVVDGPEAHLHPRAQSTMGGALARLANAGIQVLVETHSDHILSGVRLAVRDGVIKNTDVSVQFFAGTKDDTNGVTALSIDRAGAIESWPEGFFDQAEHDLARLAGWT